MTKFSRIKKVIIEIYLTLVDRFVFSNKNDICSNGNISSEPPFTTGFSFTTSESIHQIISPQFQWLGIQDFEIKGLMPTNQCTWLMTVVSSTDSGV